MRTSPRSLGSRFQNSVEFPAPVLKPLARFSARRRGRGTCISEKGTQKGGCYVHEVMSLVPPRIRDKSLHGLTLLVFH
jgi:hypothetical protein